MDNNKCPKCGKKLSILYIKQNCPECGCDLIYYNIDERLEEDARQAEAEFEALDRFITKIRKFLKIRKKEK